MAALLIALVSSAAGSAVAEDAASEVAPLRVPHVPWPPPARRRPARAAPLPLPPPPLREPDAGPTQPIVPPDLSLAASLAVARAVEADPPPLPLLGAVRGITDPAWEPDASLRVSQLLLAALARDRVTRGLIDPYFSELRSALDSAWNPEPAVSEKGLSGWWMLELERLQSFLAHPDGNLLRQAEAYGSARPSSSPGDAATQAAEELSQRAEVTRSSNSVTKTMLVELTQARDGRLIGVRVERSSDDPALDAELLRELRSGHTVLPTPPVIGRFITAKIATLWEYRLTVYIAPPIPMISGTFEEAALFDPRLGPVIDVVLPLQRRIRKHVELLEVR